MKIRLVDEAEDHYVEVPDSVEFPRVIIYAGQAYLYDDHGFYRVVYSHTIKPEQRTHPGEPGWNPNGD